MMVNNKKIIITNEKKTKQTKRNNKTEKQKRDK